MNLLTRLLAQPDIIRDWRPAQWNALMPLARRAGLLGRCRALFVEHGVEEHVPQRICDQMQGALAQTGYIRNQARRELRQVARVLAAEDIPLMALKGLAYLVANLPPAAWRGLSDIDLMVPRADIERAEKALRNRGWEPNGDYDDYDQHYYRDWMHEVPPLAHPARGFEVDLHHNLSPPVSRLRIDAERLWEAAVEHVDDCGQRVFVLDGADLLLHNAVHLFMNDELRGGLRDVVDFRDLFGHFSGREPAFAGRLVERAAALGCGRALYYVADAAQRYAGLQVPETFAGDIRRFAPPAPVAGLMQRLSGSQFAPPRPGLKRTALAEQALFVRSHWIRMPPLMLARHLARKALIKKKPEVSAGDLPG